jgi:hypothetical protein
MFQLKQRNQKTPLLELWRFFYYICAMITIKERTSRVFYNANSHFITEELTTYNPNNHKVYTYKLAGSLRRITSVNMLQLHEILNYFGINENKNCIFASSIKPFIVG